MNSAAITPLTGPPGPAGPSPSGSANQVVATPNGSSGVSALRNLVQSDLPNNMSMFGNLPNVKLVPSYNIFMPSASGPNF